MPLPFGRAKGNLMLLRIAATAIALAGTSLAGALPARADWDAMALLRDVSRIEKQAKGHLGVALLDLKDRQRWSHRGGEAFPMQSVFKLPLGIAVLQAVEAGRFKLDQPITVKRSDISLFHSPLAKGFKGDTQAYPLRELIRLTIAESDNTAADLLMRLIGGPQTVTAMLRQGGITGISVDRYERVFQPEIYGMRGFGWDEVIDEPKFRAELKALPADKRRLSLATYLRDDPRDKATPDASADLLEGLARGTWLRDPAHAQWLNRLMVDNAGGKDRIKAGLPAGSAFAHRTGASLTTDGISAATNDIGIVTLPDGRAFAIAIYLSGSTASADAREAAHAAVAKAAVAALK